MVLEVKLCLLCKWGIFMWVLGRGLVSCATECIIMYRNIVLVNLNIFIFKNEIYQYIISRTEFKTEGYLILASKKIMISVFTCVKHIEKRDKFPYGYFVQNKCLKFKWDELFCLEYGHLVHCFFVSLVDRILLGGLGVQITFRERGGLGKYYSKTFVNAVKKSCHHVLSMVLKVLAGHWPVIMYCSVTH